MLRFTAAPKVRIFLDRPAPRALVPYLQPQLAILAGRWGRSHGDDWAFQLAPGLSGGGVYYFSRHFGINGELGLVFARGTEEPWDASLLALTGSAGLQFHF